MKRNKKELILILSANEFHKVIFDIFKSIKESKTWWTIYTISIFQEDLIFDEYEKKKLNISLLEYIANDRNMIFK